MKQPSYTCSCINCKKEYSSLGIDTHYLRSHGSQEEKNLFLNSVIANKNKLVEREKNYNNSPNKCNHCNSILRYKKRNNNFCSHSCKATFTNYQRKANGYLMPEKSRQRIREKLKIVIGPYSRVYFKKCKFCNNQFVTTTRKQVCESCQHLKWKNGKDQYSFKFNVYDYPDLFDLNLLSKLGWVQFGGKRSKVKNLNGLSRDHKVSVNEAKINNYDPYYISHPCNCELMLMSDNNKKKTKSSLTYQELVEMVNAYDSTRGDH